MNDRHHPPANQDDFSRATRADPEALAQGWHDSVAGWIAEQFAALPPDGVRFFDGLDPQTSPIPIGWDAFPQIITGYFGRGREALRVADVLRPTPVGKDRNGATVTVLRRQQDEYCEWFAHRDGDDRITRVDFTCEGPEYWEHLGQDLDLVLTLYRENVSPDVAPEDLVWDRDVIDAGRIRWREGEYNPFNKWNTTHGAMHLTHRANTLGAEINLAALATILRTTDGGATYVSGVPDLACCSPFGDVNRSSDPNIGVGVNQLVQQGNVVGLADPIGLYIAELPRNDVVDDNGDPAGEWTVPRGGVDVADGKQYPRILRATVTLPIDRDVTVGGVPLEFGGQLAQRIQMVLYGVGRTAEGPPPASACEQKCCRHPEHAAIRATIAPDGVCAEFPWARFDRLFGPYTGDDGPGPADAHPETAADGLPAYASSRVPRLPDGD